MLLSLLAKSIVDALQDAPPETWSNLALNTDVPVRFALDPFTSSGEQITGPSVFVIPGYIEYSGFDKRRKDTQPTERLKFVTIALCIRITGGADTPVYDVTTEENAIKFINLKEELDEFIVQLAIENARLVGVETEPSDQFELKDSYFIVTSVLSYATC